MRVLLDTNILVQASLDKLSAKTRRILENTDTERLVSAISITEIAVKSSVGKLAITEHLTSELLRDLATTVIPYLPRHAYTLFRLQTVEGHKDPFDRMLIATALAEDIPIISTDRVFRRYKGLTVIV